jgi:hypothetical protein
VCAHAHLQEVKGIQVLTSHSEDVTGSGLRFFELVISDRNRFLGMPPGQEFQKV